MLQSATWGVSALGGCLLQEGLVLGASGPGGSALGGLVQGGLLGGCQLLGGINFGVYSFIIGS